MADVGERAQVLLMAALGMAILFVALALILNTAIYTENLATRGSEIAGGGEAIRYFDTTRSGIGGAIVYVNHYNDTSHAALQQNLSSAVRDWANASRSQSAHRGGSIDVSLIGTKDGTRIVQENDTRKFTNKSDAEHWTVAENVNRTRKFSIYASNEEGLLPLFSGDPFNVTVENGSDKWRMHITENSTINTEIDVEIRSTSGVDVTCASGSVSTWIDVTSGEVGDTDCEGLEFAEGVDPPYNITFHNGDKIKGNYTLVIDNNTLAEDTDPHLYNTSEGDDPYATPAIYSANLSATYQTPKLFYNTSIRVAPGESDD